MSRPVCFLRLSYQQLINELSCQERNLAVGFVGMPACGKGHQATILSDAGVPTQGSSAELDKLGPEHPFNQMRCAGELVPGKDMATLVTNGLEKREHPELIVLDGSPRTIEEFDALVPALTQIRYSLLLIHFKIDEKLALERRMKQISSGDTRPDTGKEQLRIDRYKQLTFPVLAEAARVGVPVKTVPVLRDSSPLYVAFQVLGKISREVFLHTSAQ